jgi:hypothetical protein
MSEFLLLEVDFKIGTRTAVGLRLSADREIALSRGGCPRPNLRCSDKCQDVTTEGGDGDAESRDDRESIAIVRQTEGHAFKSNDGVLVTTRLTAVLMGVAWMLGKGAHVGD